MMRQREPLGSGARGDLANRVAGGQRVLYHVAEMLILDLRTRHIAAMHQKVGTVGELCQALAVYGITADGNHLALCFKTIAVAHPALQECRGEAKAVAVPDPVGRGLPATAL